MQMNCKLLSEQAKGETSKRKRKYFRDYFS